jgi:DNA-binding MarR family transcriptional regulator
MATPDDGIDGGGKLLFLTDDQMRQNTELIFFAYRAFTSDPDAILTARGLGRAHHRALHFIGSRRKLSVGALMEILGVTKQSLNRVLRELIEKGLVKQEVGAHDRRQRLLVLSKAGEYLEAELAASQRMRLRRAFLEAGSEAVEGFRDVLERMLDPEYREPLRQFITGEGVRPKR